MLCYCDWLELVYGSMHAKLVMVSSAVFWVVVGSLLAVLTQTVHSTPAPEVRIWKCESDISKYTDAFCDQQGEIRGCYCLKHSGTCRSCASICNGAQEYSIDEERCNDNCPDYLSQDGECTLVYDVETTTSTTTTTTTSTTPSAIPSTTTNKTFTKPITTNHTVATTTTHGSKSSSSCVVPVVVTGLVCLVIGAALGVGGTYFYFKRKVPTDPDNHNGNEDGEPIPLTVLNNRANRVDDANHGEAAAMNGHANSP